MSDPSDDRTRIARTPRAVSRPAPEEPRTERDLSGETSDGHLDELSLAELAEGRLSQAERQVAFGHLDRCERCRQVVAELSRGAAEGPDTGTAPTHISSSGSKSAPLDSLIGSSLGEYVVLEPMSRGGMGAVYRGTQPLIGKHVAIKVLLPHIADDPEQVHRLLAEARAVNAIRHPNIVDIFSFGNLPDGRHYFVMELLDGESLAKLLHGRRALPLPDALDLLDQAFAALDAAHGAGVIHRDIKPGNMFVTTLPDGTRRVKLLDFGLAKISGASSATAPNVMMGTPGYMAPEQIRGEPVTPRADLYAMGVVAYRLLTGREPFEASSAVEVMTGHLDKPVPPLGLSPEVPPALEALVLELLEKDPARRPPSAAAVRQGLSEVRRELGTRATTLREVRAPELVGRRPAAREGGSRTWLWMSAFALAVAAVGGLGWRLSSAGDAVEPPAPLPPLARPTPPPEPRPEPPPEERSSEQVTPPPPQPRPKAQEHRRKGPRTIKQPAGPTAQEVERRISSLKGRSSRLPTAGIRRIVQHELASLSERLAGGEAPGTIASELDALARQHDL